MQTRDQEVRIISCADATELGQPRNSFQKKKCLESWEPGAEHLSLADSQRPAQARDGSGMRVRCSSTPKRVSGPPDGLRLTKSVLKTGLRASSARSHLPPKCYVTEPERQKKRTTTSWETASTCT